MPILRVLLGRVRLACENRVRSLYYGFGYHRSFPGKRWVESGVRALEDRSGRGDVPKSKESWNQQYAVGGWDFLAGIEELAHYSVIVGYASWFRPRGAVLDVGCGAGVLHDRFLTVGYDSYTGVDISDVAITALTDRALPNADFHAHDAETFDPGRSFDVVVFNESITYFHDPAEQFERYLQYVADGGIVIVSCHVQSVRAQAVLRQLESRWTTLDASEVRRDATSWRVVAFAPVPRSEARAGAPSPV